MQPENSSKPQIIQEQRNISKCAGLLYSRLLLLACLFFLSIPMRPTSFYLLIFFSLVPWIVSNILSDKRTAEPVVLSSCAKKYRYTSIQLTVEQHVGRIAVFLLAVWQISAARFSVTTFLQLVPGIILLLYLLCRILCTILVRRQIHHYYFNLISLENDPK